MCGVCFYEQDVGGMCLCLHVVYIACASYVYVWHMYLCVPLGGLPVSLSLYMCSTYVCGFLCVLVSLRAVWCMV